MQVGLETIKSECIHKIIFTIDPDIVIKHVHGLEKLKYTMNKHLHGLENIKVYIE